MRKSFIFFTFFCCSLVLASAANIKLSGMDLKKAYQQYGGLMVGSSVTGEPAQIAGVKYADAIGVHAKSIIKIDLRNNGIRLKTGIGVADSQIDYADASITSVPLVDGKRVFYTVTDRKKTFAGVEGQDGKVDQGTALFRILGNGKELYSAVMKSGEPMKMVDLPLEGVSLLELIVEEGSDGSSGDYGLWVAPELEYFEVLPITVNTDFMGEVASIDPKVMARLKQQTAHLPKISLPLKKASFDWLIQPDQALAEVFVSEDGKSIILSNGLVARVFRITPNLATTDLINQMTDETLLRAVSSEGTVRIDGNTWNLGGLQGQPERGYIKPEWIDQMTPLPNSFLLEDMEVNPLAESMEWAQSRWALNKQRPTGKTLTFTLRGTGELSEAVVKLHYDLYDRLPLIRKRMDLFCEGDRPFNLDEFQLEYLAFAEPESPVGGDPAKFLRPNISIETNYAFGGFTEKESDHTEKWITDADYTSQCNYAMMTPCILEVSLPVGPDCVVSKKQPFRSFDVYEMPYDSYDRERQGLFKRRMYRTVAPWTSENPIFMHLTTTDPETVKTAVDQCVATGYEMIILSFGSGLDMEDKSEENYARFRRMAEYARSKGIELGGYSLLSSRWISDEVDVINPETGKRGGMIFGSSPCLCSDWGYDYFEKIKTFCEKTGFSVFEHDGSYPGNVCASTTHAHHNGLKDSQWKQFAKITELYKWMCAKGIYINVPDYYFLNGSTKAGIGYREVNWSLPRDRQLIHGRQVNYNGTWDRPASACWTFVPLVEYHGGGEAATLEPLNDHLETYKAHMIQNYGAGIQACYRGPRLYDTPATQAVVTEVIRWYKQYRNILNSDIIHLRKADGRDWDGILHVNPAEKEKGLALFFNPLDQPVTRTINVPLYYTGLTDQARIREQEGDPVSYQLKRDYSVDVTLTIPANGSTWLVIEK